MRRLWWLPLALAAAVQAGCSSLAYYGQSIHGHLDLLGRQQPIARLIADHGAADEALRARLVRVQRLRDFASAELGLPDNASYRRYAALERPFVVWSVMATPELSLEPETWCFPFAGCVGYRGYFDEAEARAFAAGLAADGRDVFVGGVPAYSTLGWLDDPLPSTVIHWSEHRLAGLIFHELAHQVVYVADDTAFNEAFATAVQQAGVRRWLAANGGESALAAYAEELAAQQAFLTMVAALRAELAALYASDLPAAAKRRGKRDILAAFQARRDGLPEQVARRYGHWFETPLNNARLASVALYHDLVPAFEALLADVDGDLPAFYRRVEALASHDRLTRRERLDELTTKYAKNTKNSRY